MSEARQGANPEQNPYSQAKIWIVDDDAVIRKLLKNILEKDGYTTIEEASDGAQAWALLEGILESGDPKLLKIWPDAAVVNYQMPGLDGVELIRRIREIDPKLLAQKGLKSPAILGRSGMSDYFRRKLEDQQIPGPSIAILPESFSVIGFTQAIQTTLESHFAESV